MNIDHLNMIFALLTTGALTGLSLVIFFLFFWKIKIYKNLTRDSSKGAKQKINKFVNYGKLPPVYPNGWFNLLESSALKKEEVKHISALGQNFAVFRTKKGVACVLDAYCPHLGANLAEGGIVKNGELQCPFHSWRFCGKTGKCTHIPNSKKVSEKFKAKVWDCAEVNGFIFVWYHAESAPPNWWLKQTDQISNGSWKLQGSSEIYLKGHIQDFTENTVDSSHFDTVHDFNIIAKYFWMSKIFRHTWTSVKWSKYSDDDPSTAARLRELELSNLLKHNPGENHKSLVFVDYEISMFKMPIVQSWMLLNLVGPGYIEVFMKTYFGFLYGVHSVTPIKPRIQRFSHLVYTPMILAPFAKIFVLADYWTVYSDARIWEFKKYLESPMLAKMDRYIKPFRRWYNQFYSKNSPTYESCKNSTIEW